MMLANLVGCNVVNDTELVDCLRSKRPDELLNQEFKVTQNIGLLIYAHCPWHRICESVSFGV